jgi:hypothetical protein
VSKAPGDSAAKPKQPEPTLGEILSGVDIIGTMLHLDLPKLEQQLAEIRKLVTPASVGDRLARPEATDTAAALEEIRDQLQVQGERLLALERRLLHLTALCEESAAVRKGAS